MEEGKRKRQKSATKYPDRERMEDPDEYVLALDEEADYWQKRYWGLEDRFTDLCAIYEKMLKVCGEGFCGEGSWGGEMRVVVKDKGVL